jgi:hypothetical protein
MASHFAHVLGAQCRGSLSVRASSEWLVPDKDGGRFPKPLFAVMSEISIYKRRLMIAQRGPMSDF